MSFEKFPRWALVTISGALLGICLFFTSRAVADSDKMKAVAYQARTTADNAYMIANDLKIQVADVRGAQETFRREYREDRQRDVEQLQRMEERIIRAVKTA